MTRQYQYNCTDAADEAELAYLVGHMTEISLKKFRQGVNPFVLEDLLGNLGYTDDFPVSRDYHVKYFQSPLPGQERTAYILRHSAIEYVFY